jgi:hypothetical protein
MSYIGIPPFGQTVRTTTELTASASQTTFTPSGGYLPGYIDITINGVELQSSDFTAVNGTTVVLAVACAAGDEFKSKAYWPVTLVDVTSTSVAKGGGSDKIFFENDQVVTSNYTITSGKNAMSAGNITINDGVTVTTPSGSVWTIV